MGNIVIMEPECRAIANELMPAVRVILANQMKKKYRMTQQEIANKLGIAQVAVSKYINGNYSKAVARAAKRISKQMPEELVARIARSSDMEQVNRIIEKFCESQVNA
ncbi:MAG: helix-turn-helix domain-containing protein [Candidatus Micrarchaeaceae archaeon]